MVNKRPAARAARRRARTWGTSKQARDDNSPSRVPSARLGAIRMPTSTTRPYRCAQSRLERRDSCCRAAKAPRSLSFADGRTRESRVRNGLSAGGRWIRKIGPSRTNRSFLRNGKLAPENFTTTLCTTVATPNSVAQLLVDNPLFDWCRLAARPSLLRNRRNTSSSVGTFRLRPSLSA